MGDHIVQFIMQQYHKVQSQRLVGGAGGAQCSAVTTASAGGGPPSPPLWCTDVNIHHFVHWHIYSSEHCRHIHHLESWYKYTPFGALYKYALFGAFLNIHHFVHWHRLWCAPFGALLHSTVAQVGTLRNSCLVGSCSKAAQRWIWIKTEIKLLQRVWPSVAAINTPLWPLWPESLNGENKDLNLLAEGFDHHKLECQSLPFCSIIHSSSAQVTCFMEQSSVRFPSEIDCLVLNWKRKSVSFHTVSGETDHSWEIYSWRSRARSSLPPFHCLHYICSITQLHSNF